MPWGYRQSTGEISLNGINKFIGYSGHGEGRNNPDLQFMANVGPIPQGHYKISPAYDDPHLGPCVMRLDPMPGTNTFGRSAFRLHGDNVNHDASLGCIVAGPLPRKTIDQSTDHILIVEA